ncbi:hypothetical protein ABZ696_04220 [Streptomyces albidoflavus]|uniref:hypothetical protein n=1 Tax=Streptomyces albidoflavus TaxID=1886 RepID=UPI00340628F4
MAITVSLAVLLGLALFLLVRLRYVGFGSALIAAAFGFFLASTGAAGPINRLTQSVLGAIPGL